MSANDPTSGRDGTESRETGAPNAVQYVVVSKMRAEDDTDTCLRPLGLCELGGACDACWYRPDHPRFNK